MTREHNNEDAEEQTDPAEGWTEAIGAPEGFWSEAKQSTDVDDRVPENHSRSESRSDPYSEDPLMPIEKVGAPGVTNSQLDDYGITRSEARFMRAVVKAMNRELDGYNLTMSMVGIREHYDIHEEKLIEAGYLKRHAGVSNRAYYTVTFAGQDACGLQKKQGREIGDVGADTPHRVGVDLARRYYRSLSHVRRPELAVRENGQTTDLLVIDENGTRIAIIEVEGSRVEVDPYVSEEDRTGLTNYESVQTDYHVLAASAGTSIWVARNYEIAGDILQVLSSGDDIPFEVPKDVYEAVGNKDKRIKDLNEDHLAPLEGDGINKIVTFRQLRNWFKEVDS